MHLFFLCTLYSTEQMNLVTTIPNGSLVNTILRHNMLQTGILQFQNPVGVKNSLKALCIFTTVTKHVFLCS